MPTDGTRLQVELRHRDGALDLDLQFVARAPWTVLFGPSGSGKSTALRAIAGFVAPQSGRVVAESPSDGSIVLLDRARGVSVPAYRRPVRTSAQQPQMFPGRTARDNVSYGAPGRRDLVQQALDRLHLSDRAESRVELLSGGEQQRLAVARAIAAAWSAGPGTWLLLDEPFTGLDLPLRQALTADLPPWLSSLHLPVLSVTHDVAEVLALGAAVVRIDAGRIRATGPGHEVLAGERDQLLAELTAKHQTAKARL